MTTSFLFVLFIFGNNLNADIVGTIPNATVFNGYSFSLPIYSGGYDRFMQIYNKIPDTISMDIPFTTAMNTYIALADKNPFNWNGATKSITNYISTNIQSGADLNTVLQDQLIKLVNFPTNKAETKKFIAGLPAGADKSQVNTVSNPTKEIVTNFASDVLDNLGKQLGLTDEENDIVITAIYTGEIKFTITKFNFVPGIGNKIVMSLQKNTGFTPSVPYKIYGTQLLGGKKAIFDYLRKLFSTNSPYVDGTTARNIGVISPDKIRISGSNFAPTNNIVKLTLNPSSDANDSASLLATPHTFISVITDFFKNAWKNTIDFIIGIIPTTHGQTVSTPNFYLIEGISSDDTSTSSITFTIPSYIPKGSYSVDVGSFDSDWLPTNFNIIIGSTGISVTGSTPVATPINSPIPGVINANYGYYCPTFDATTGGSGFIYQLSGKTCIPTSYINHASSVGLNAATVCSGGSISFGGICIASSILAIPATLGNYCTNTYYLAGSICIPRSSITKSVASQLTGTTTLTSQPAFVTYSCDSGSVMSGNICIPTKIACAASINSLSNNNSCKPTTYSATATYSCPSGYTISGTTCYVNSNETTSNLYTSDQININVVTTKTATTATVQATSSTTTTSTATTTKTTSSSGATAGSGSSLPSSTVSNGAPTTLPAVVKYTCDALASSGGVCVHSPATILYTCPVGYYLFSQTKTCVLTQ